MLYHVKDLSTEQKQTVEILLGHAVAENETLSIKSLDPATIVPSKLSPAARIAAMKALDERFAARPIREVSSEEEDDLVREAFRSTHSENRPAR